MFVEASYWIHKDVNSNKQNIDVFKPDFNCFSYFSIACLQEDFPTELIYSVFSELEMMSEDANIFSLHKLFTFTVFANLADFQVYLLAPVINIRIICHP